MEPRWITEIREKCPEAYVEMMKSFEDFKTQILTIKAKYYDDFIAKKHSQ